MKGSISSGSADWRGTRTPVTGLATISFSRTHQLKNAERLAR